MEKKKGIGIKQEKSTSTGDKRTAAQSERQNARGNMGEMHRP